MQRSGIMRQCARIAASSSSVAGARCASLWTEQADQGRGAYRRRGFAREPSPRRRGGRAKSLAIKGGQRPSAARLREGLREPLGSELGEPAKRLGARPEAEPERVDRVA